MLVNQGGPTAAPGARREEVERAREGRQQVVVPNTCEELGLEGDLLGHLRGGRGPGANRAPRAPGAQGFERSGM